jgi:hypothetical protein
MARYRLRITTLEDNAMNQRENEEWDKWEDAPGQDREMHAASIKATRRLVEAITRLDEGSSKLNRTMVWLTVIGIVVSVIGTILAIVQGIRTFW